MRLVNWKTNRKCCNRLSFKYLPSRGHDSGCMKRQHECCANSRPSQLQRQKHRVSHYTVYAPVKRATTVTTLFSYLYNNLTLYVPLINVQTLLPGDRRMCSVSDRSVLLLCLHSCSDFLFTREYCNI